MSRQIIRQPNGKFCVFSSIVENILYYNMSKKGLIDVWTEEHGHSGKKEVLATLEQLKRNEKPYQQFTLTFNEAIQEIKRVHGKTEIENLMKLMQQ